MIPLMCCNPGISVQGFKMSKIPTLIVLMSLAVEDVLAISPPPL